MSAPGSRRQTGVTRPAPVTITCDGIALQAYPGETLAAALIAMGQRATRMDTQGRPRGPFCNMGTCSECFLWVAADGDSWQRRRACLTPVAPGLRLRTQEPEEYPHAD